MSPPDGVTGDTRYFKRDEIENKVVLLWIRHRPYVYHPWETKKLSFIGKTLLDFEIPLVTKKKLDLCSTESKIGS